MPDKPQSRPEPAKPSPDVYGDRWGEAGKQNPQGPPQGTDRPDRIKPPEEPQGFTDPESPVGTQSED